MVYFKHLTKMRHDPKIKRLINRYGIEGYGLYCLIIESIVEELTTESPKPELNESCEDLAEFYNGNTSKINEMASFMINQGLIEVDEITAKITCKKIYKYIEQSQTRSKAIRSLIKSYKTASDLPLLSQTDTDISDRRRIVEQEVEKEQEQEVEKEVEEKDKYLDYVYLTNKEYYSLTTKYNKLMIDNYIEKLDYYLENNKEKRPGGNKPYSSHYKTILNWMRRDGIKPDIKKRTKCEHCGKPYVNGKCYICDDPDLSPEDKKEILERIRKQNERRANN